MLFYIANHFFVRYSLIITIPAAKEDHHELFISCRGGNAGAFSAYLGFNREEKTDVAVAVNYGLVNAEQIGFAILKS